MPTVDVDQRRIVGARVKAKAVHVASESEASRRDGQLSKTKMVFGTVLSVDTAVNPTTNRSTTTVVAEYDFGGGVTKRKSLNIRSVHVVAPEEENQQSAPAESPNEPTGNHNDDNPIGTDTHNELLSWSRTAKFMYIPAPCFGITGMSRTIFFSDVSGLFISQRFVRWMDRKPEAGCEVQNAADGGSGVILRLKLVKTELEAREDDELTLGAKVAKYLVESWARTDRFVCGNSFFASVATAKELKPVGLRFIGVVKTASSHYSMTWLSSVEQSNRGDHKGLVHLDNDGNPDMMAFVWVDRERRYSISNCSSLVEGDPHVRNRWRQVDDMEAEPEREELIVPTTKVCNIF
ncbi:transposase IS4 [Nitzschia inconspicua]|uniref:Transposase IS4 n=1 Tax=Nitzschia inconspicua TaxID=303405 RepID=A0A9K3PLE7_9STRA|nr:transposase IS4 [Nitzschia inconspicua]